MTYTGTYACKLAAFFLGGIEDAYAIWSGPLHIGTAIQRRPCALVVSLAGALPGFEIILRSGGKVLKRKIATPNNRICTAIVEKESDASSARVQQVGSNSPISNILFPEAGQLRSRRVVSRSRARPAGKYPSWKMRRMVQWESENELNAFRLLDCDPDVTRFNEQPCEIMYALDGQLRCHYPDILVERNGRRELWEVKNEARAEELEVVTRTKLLTEELPRWGYAYLVVLAKDLAMQPRLANACFLLGFGRGAVSDCEQEFIRQTIKQRGSLLWSDASSGKYGPRGREILCSLVLRGVLTIDLNAPISPGTRFIARKGKI